VQDHIHGGITSSPPCSVAGAVKFKAGLKVEDPRLTNGMAFLGLVLTSPVQVEIGPEIY